jgi:microcystin-dependent protein
MDPIIGQIQAFGFSFSIQGWAFCDGSLLSIAENSPLFALIGTTYGGDGVQTFGLPDLRGRSAIHSGQGSGLSNFTLGQNGGTENATLIANNLPPHNHAISVSVNTANGEEATPTGILAASAGSYSEDVTAGAKLGGVSEQSVGQNQPFAIRKPYLGVNYSIALEGIFPSRN